MLSIPLHNRFHHGAALVSIANAFFLLFVSWEKYITKACSACSFIPWLTVGDEFIGLLGAGMAFFIAGLASLAGRNVFLGYLAFYLTLFSLVFGTLIQLGRFWSLGSFCTQCLLSDALFSLTAMLLALWLWKKRQDKKENLHYAR
ncbi:hypothetical protein [Heliorestis convoluta]|uniref:Putative membrane protein n=1 Tax=Heliorestis convoluta TaxID=356322 RepID=A0A5Q2MYT3_9FIRM|nr:hypothetical protein [Heliorestis convoluta]QGG46583.1 putative membrane protein [Heliorestis convoluta]